MDTNIKNLIKSLISPSLSKKTIKPKQILKDNKRVKILGYYSFKW